MSYVARFIFIALFALAMAGCASTPNAKEEGVMRIVAIGDSITQGGTLPKHKGHRNTIPGGWVARLEEWLAQHLGDRRIEVFNEGVTGNTTFALEKRLDTSLFVYDPDIILLGVGTNDINSNWMGWLGKTFIGKSAQDVTSYEKVIRQIFDRIKEESPTARIFIVGMSTPTQRYWSETFWGFTIKMPDQITVDQAYDDYNAMLAQSACDFGFTFIDIASHWPDDPNESWALYADGIHPNDKGYDLMAHVIAFALSISEFGPRFSPLQGDAFWDGVEKNEPEHLDFTIESNIGGYDSSENCDEA
jgi:lysophospholipase L1-like esterase